MSLHNIDRRYTWSPFCLVNCLGCVDGYWQGNNNSSSRQSTVCMKWVGESKDCIRERERDITPSNGNVFDDGVFYLVALLL